MYTEPKKAALSKLMIVSLIEACAKQIHGVPFGPADVKGGSFGALINRELVVLSHATIQNSSQPAWRLTPEAFRTLKKLGVQIERHF